jgi:hypothetical protein
MTAAMGCAHELLRETDLGSMWLWWWTVGTSSS